MNLNTHKAGLALGGLLGTAHLVWSLMVLIGVGQTLLDFVFKLHMIHPVYTVGPFDIVMSVSLVIVTSVMGYAFGYVFALIWNRVHST